MGQRIVSLLSDIVCLRACHGVHIDSQVLSRKHPLASWFSTMLMCFASIVLVNIILGEPPITPLTNHRDLLTATIVWYSSLFLIPRWLTRTAHVYRTVYSGITCQ